MRTVVTGASGMLGYAVVRELKSQREKEYQGWSKSIAKAPGITFEQVDLTDHEKLQAQLREYKPELIIHCAALTDADYCEENPQAARELNALVPGQLARTAKALGAKMVHVSTDAVYRDNAPGTRKESECPEPLSVYAKTKLEGEGRALAAYPEVLVVRTTMFGWTLKQAPRPKFAEHILAALTNRKPIKLFRDAYFSPLHVATLAECLLDLAELGTGGILNLGAYRPVSKSDFGYQIAEVFGLDSRLIEIASVDDVPLKARRTKNVGLDTGQFAKLFGKPPTVAEELERLLDEAFDGTAKAIRERNLYP